LFGQHVGLGERLEQWADTTILERHDPGLLPRPAVDLFHCPGKEFPVLARYGEVIQQPPGKTLDGGLVNSGLAQRLDPGSLKALDAGDMDFAGALDGQPADVLARIPAQVMRGDAGVRNIEQQAAAGFLDHAANDVRQKGRAQMLTVVVLVIFNYDALRSKSLDHGAYIMNEVLGQHLNVRRVIRVSRMSG
jgi:hypothetical protein